MKKILLILALLMPMIALGQSREYNQLYGKAQELFDAEKYEEAIECLKKCDAIDQKQLEPSHQAEYDIAMCRRALSDQLYSQGKYNEAIEYETLAATTLKKLLGEEHPDYATSLNDLAGYNSYIGNYTEAIRLGTIAMEIWKKALGEEHPDYATSLSNLAGYNSIIGNYTEAIRLGTIAMEISKKVLGEEDPDYATVLSDLAMFNCYIGNYTEAIRLGTIALEIRKKVLGEEDPDYATSLSNLAMFNYDIGNYTEAIRLETIAMEIRKKVLGEEHPDYATSLNNLAACNGKIGNYTEAIRLETITMEIRKEVLGEEHPNYATSLSNLATCNYYIGNYTEAIRLGTIAMEIRKKVLGEEHPAYAFSLDNLAMFNSDIGNYTEAIRLGTIAMEIRKKVLGEEHPAYATSLYRLAEYFFYTNNYDESVKFIKQYYECSSTFILKSFSSMTNQERSNYWNMYSAFYSNNLTEVAYALSVEPSYYGGSTYADVTTLAYNGQVLSKGLLLNAEIEIQKIIEQSGDIPLSNLYYKLKQDRTTLDNLYQISPDKRPMDADSLQKVIDNEERLLVESSKELGDYTKNLSIKWTDIQKNLKNNDIAIEFANFTDSTDQTIYTALVIKKGMVSPELVKLDFVGSDTADYSSPTLYNRIWKPLDKYLQGVQNVYFSPAGKFHTIGIEYLPNNSGEIFAKQYNAYRLSSTRELALQHETNPNKKASVYGGIVYNFDESDWQNVAEENAERAGEALTFLKGAKVESEEITDILKNGSFDVEYGTDKAATEESFKKLSGSGIKILHVATHGFYEPENKENSFANMLSFGDEHSQEDRSLSRSGLFFAGANTFLNPEQRQFIPEGVDDGILTAKEISRLDFKGLDLVVLSACETGLGEVTGEGVFGLQRGFKKAGAQTIIMTLWNVNDKPAKEFMTEFYRNLMAGKTKREAFISAQDKNRLKYFDPKMWAGFIMVDGEE